MVVETLMRATAATVTKDSEALRAMKANVKVILPQYRPVASYCCAGFRFQCCRSHGGSLRI